MGLSGAKTKNKISRDPNNNGWASSTDRFGHRMLTAQGWTPGSYLGAKNAAQSEHFTVANASHIRVLLKDDNLGLGAKRGAKADTFGLSTLQGIFGRLNGKSDEELVKQEKTHRDSELAHYQTQRWGHVQFISGGFLVGDSIQRLRSEKMTSGLDSGEGSKIEVSTSKVLKKRKRDQPASSDASTKKSRARREDEASSKILGSIEAVSDAAEEDQDAQDSTSGATESLDKRQRREERRRRKAEKQQRRLERQARRQAKALRREKRPPAERDEEPTIKETTPIQSDTNTIEVQTATTAAAPVGRHAVRSRYIRQKRMAMSDTKALNEILMIKAQG